MVSGLCMWFWCSLRAQFSGGSSSINQLHGSGSSDEAEREIGFFFPPEDTLAVIKPDTEHKGIISAVTPNTDQRVERDISCVWAALFKLMLLKQLYHSSADTTAEDRKF